MNTKTILIATLVLLLTINTSAEIAPELEEEMNQLPSNERIEIILTTGPSMNQTHVNQAGNAGEVQNTFDNFNTIQLELPVQAVEQLERRSFVETVEPNYQVETILEESTTQIEAENAWENNLTGKGVDVAVLDTGIQATHPELQVENQVDFTGQGTQDENGHGTHVAGIIASQDNQNTGVAYNADLQNVKVLGENGTGEGSDLLSGLEWAIENDVEVAVMSLGAQVSECDGEDFISDAVNQAVQEGVFVTVAAGNQGPDTQTLTAPGCAEKPLTVGSVNKNNEIASYSSRGPTADNRVKPDVVAPGSNIESTYLNEGFETLSGTSMATPHAAAQAATILQQKPGLTPEETKQLIKNNTDDLGLEANTQGTGLINLTATTQQITDTNQTNETEENQTIEEGEVYTEIQNPEDQDNITVSENLTVEWRSINNKTTQLQELETSSVELGPYEAIVPENMLIGTTESISREHTITSSNIPPEGEYQLNVTDNWQNDTQTSHTVTIQVENKTQQEEEEEENRTTNRTGPELPPQASETARKATSGFFNPTSPFYRFDLAYDKVAVAIGLKTKESVMEERASEARAMLEAGNQKAAERAVNELRKTAGNSENATRQAEQTLENLMQNATEESQQGLRNAYRNVQRNSGNQAPGNRPENTGSQGSRPNQGQSNSPGQSGNQAQNNNQNQNQQANQGNQQRGNQQGNEQGQNQQRPNNNQNQGPNNQQRQSNQRPNDQTGQPQQDNPQNQGNQQNGQSQEENPNEEGQQGQNQQGTQEGNEDEPNQQQQDTQNNGNQGQSQQDSQDLGNTNPTSSNPSPTSPSSNEQDNENSGGTNSQNNSPSSNNQNGNSGNRP